MELVFLDMFFYSTILLATIVGTPFGIVGIELFAGTGGLVGIFAIVAVAA